MMPVSAFVTSVLVAMLILGVSILLVLARQRRCCTRTAHKPLPPGCLPGGQPWEDGLSSGGVLVRALRSTELAQPFFGREELDAQAVFLLSPTAHLSPTRCALALVSHISRCGSTLLCRMLDARGDVITYREPPTVTELTLRAVRLRARKESRAVGVLRAALGAFLAHADSLQKKLAVVKLPSVCCSAAALEILNAAAPASTLRVHLTRPLADVLDSHSRSSTRLSSSGDEHDVSRSPLEILEGRHAAAASWASVSLPFGEVTSPSCDLGALSELFGLPPPTSRQAAAMRAEQAFDAKTGEIRAEPGVPSLADLLSEPRE